MTIVEKVGVGSKFILVKDEVTHLRDGSAETGQVVILVSPATQRWYAIDLERFRRDYVECF